jgi:hypothetical protein
MYNWHDLIRPMELQQAINFLGASRKAYNKNSGEKALNFQETFDMIEECAPNCGTNQDHAMMKTIQAHIDEKLAKLEAQLWKELARQVDVKAVNKMLKDPMLFEDSDEYMMTEEEYEESEFYDRDNGYGY